MFRPVFIEARDLNDAYFSLLWNLHARGRKYEITSGSFVGSNRLEFDFCSGFIYDPHIRPLAPIMPPGMSAITTDEKIEQYFAEYLMNPELSDNEHYKYAQWINGIYHYSDFCFVSEINKTKPDGILIRETPLAWVIRHFQEKGYGNNHCYINVGNADSQFNYDVPFKNESERKTSPCLRGIDFKIKDGKLITSVVFRSWDLFAGFPENMGGFALLNEYVADQLPGVSPGPLAFNCSGLHCYDYQIQPLLSILHK